MAMQHSSRGMMVWMGSRVALRGRECGIVSRNHVSRLIRDFGVMEFGRNIGGVGNLRFLSNSSSSNYNSSSHTPHPCHARAFASEYIPKEVERDVVAWWDSERPRQEEDRRLQGGGDSKRCFSMVLPPPNVTGQLHLGHALTVTVQDSLVRYYRMCGAEVNWVPGVDHAGIATQSVVERRLVKDGLGTRHSLGREEFLKHVWAWCDKYSGRIDAQLKRLGASLDWDRRRFTLDEQSSLAVTRAFVTLHRRGLVYRGTRLVNWCPHLGTAISDLEIDYEELLGPTVVKLPSGDSVECGVVHDFAYKVLGEEDKEVVVSTTRLETMLGDSGVAVHPEDPRYAWLTGKFLVHPFFPERSMPIVADATLVDIEVGTGAVKLTPAHDPNDFECGQRHGLEEINILNNDGTLNESCGAEWVGKSRFVARKELVDKLRALGLYRGKKANAMLLGRCSRSGDIVEPLLKPQWFVKCDDMAARALAFAEPGGGMKIVPTFHKNTWTHFLDNIQDWCVSRQLWWGHRIPAFRVVPASGADIETEDQMWVVAHEESEAAQQAIEEFGLEPNSFSLKQDEDVLDTWFSSSIFPLTALGWSGEKTDKLSPTSAYPLSLMETGADILFFWVARMVMMCSELHDKNAPPFEKVFLHPIVRDRQGRKMSKSLGNVLDPLHVIDGVPLTQLEQEVAAGNLNDEEVKRATKGMREDFPEGVPACGTDALRLALASYMHEGSPTINMDIDRVVQWRHFGNKVWNAQRFVMMQFSISGGEMSGIGHQQVEQQQQKELHLEARWVLSKLARFVAVYNKAMEAVELDKATQQLQSFVVGDLCDVFIEASKIRLNNCGGPGALARRQDTLRVLVECLETSLKLAHPLAPFLTEELWHRLLAEEPIRAVQSLINGDSRVAFKPSDLLCLQSFPQAQAYKHLIDVPAEEEMELVMDCVRTTRALRQKLAGVVDRDALHECVQIMGDNIGIHALRQSTELICALTRQGAVDIIYGADDVNKTASGGGGQTIYLEQAVRPGVLVRMPVCVQQGDKDRIATEAAAQEKRLAKQLKVFGKIEKNLSSPRFLIKAPPHIQESERQKLVDAQAAIDTLEMSIQTLKALL